MFTVSMILACLFFCLCNDVVMRYTFPHALLSKNRGKTFRFSIFISRGLQSDHDHLHTERKSVRHRGKVRGEISGVEESNRVL